MPTVTLTPHPATPCPSVHALTVDWDVTLPGRLTLTYRLNGALDDLTVPPANPDAGRVDELWRHTCFEAFLFEGAGPAYWEFNFSPSGDWAVYRFDAYRQGMAAPGFPHPPRIHCSRDAGMLELSVELELPEPAGRSRQLAIAAVLETAAGAHGYWALSHPSGPPDFHHADGFALRLTV